MHGISDLFERVALLVTWLHRLEHIVEGHPSQFGNLPVANTDHSIKGGTETARSGRGRVDTTVEHAVAASLALAVHVFASAICVCLAAGGLLIFVFVRRPII